MAANWHRLSQDTQVSWGEKSNNLSMYSAFGLLCSHLSVRSVEGLKWRPGIRGRLGSF